MTEPTRRSPLAHRGSLSDNDHNFSMAERPFLGKIILRADVQEAAKPVSHVLDMSLPHEPNTASCDGDMLIQWLGPDEWVIFTPPGAEQEVHHKLCQHLE